MTWRESTHLCAFRGTETEAETIGTDLTKRVGKARELVGLAGLYAFSFFAFLSHGRALVGLALVIVACLVDARFWSATRHSAAIWLAGAMGAYILLRTATTASMNPETADLHLEAGMHLLLLCAFVFLAWTIGGNQRRILVLLALTLAGFVAGSIEHFDLSFSIPLAEQQPQFGLPTANAFGEYAAAAMLGLAILAPRLWQATKGRSYFWIVGPIWLLGFLVAAQSVVLSQTRTVWLSLVLLLPLLLFLYAHKLAAMRWTAHLTIVLLIAAAVTAIWYPNRETLQTRLSKEGAITYENIRNGTIGRTPQEESIGQRVHMVLFGLRYWKEQPAFGLGPGATRPLMKIHGSEFSDNFIDLHNSYVEILLWLGLVGLGLLLSCFGYVLRAGWRAYRAGQLEHDVFVLLATSLSLHLLANLGSSRLISKDGIFFWLLFGSALAAMRLRGVKISQHEPASVSPKKSRESYSQPKAPTAAE